MKSKAIQTELPEFEISYRHKVDLESQPKIKNPLDAYRVLRKIWDAKKLELREDVVMLALGEDARLLGWIRLFSGGWSSSIIDPRLIFQVALNCRASSIILSHNHPSGNLRPSQEDIRLTKRLIKGGKLLGTELADHIIISKKSYFSFKDTHSKLWNVDEYI